jgi:hypothetical protein
MTVQIEKEQNLLDPKKIARLSVIRLAVSFSLCVSVCIYVNFQNAAPGYLY